MEEQVNWWEGVYLCRRSGRRGVRPTELFRGQLVEAIHAALARPEEERPRLTVTFETRDRSLAWPRIAKLAARPDFPTLI